MSKSKRTEAEYTEIEQLSERGSEYCYDLLKIKDRRILALKKALGLFGKNEFTGKEAREALKRDAEVEALEIGLE